MKKGNLLIVIALEGFGIWIIIESFKLGLQTFNDPGPGLFPFLLGILLCLLAIPVMVSDARNLKKPKAEEEENQSAHGTGFGKLGAITGSLIGYFLFLEVAGFLVTTFFFLSALLLMGYPRKWFFSFWVSAIVVAAAYLIFGVLLQIPFPLGLWR